MAMAAGGLASGSRCAHGAGWGIVLIVRTYDLGSSESRTSWFGRTALPRPVGSASEQDVGGAVNDGAYPEDRAAQELVDDLKRQSRQFHQ